ncbi:MAG TPA: hypothetical protein VMT28_04875 [Terriglobales bacterium]|jgi:hypothetical protein|nr:hypothetical protein [Terriglobales bacterium]
MSGLDSWLKQATRHLSECSAARVRREIQEHYESAREAAMSGGATAKEADRMAVVALGDARTANCQYRSVLLTAAEARMLREGNVEARLVCSQPWLKWLLLAAPVGMLVASSAYFLAGAMTTARVLLAGGIALGVLLAAPFLPIYTPSRSRAYRVVKWVVLAAGLGLAFGSDMLKWSWLLTTCLWILGWTEWTRISIRRKLPVGKWPKQLYL